MTAIDPNMHGPTSKRPRAAPKENWATPPASAPAAPSELKKILVQHNIGHFPQICYCGQEFETLRDWIDHVVALAPPPSTDKSAEGPTAPSAMKLGVCPLNKQNTGMALLEALKPSRSMLDSVPESWCDLEKLAEALNAIVCSASAEPREAAPKRVPSANKCPRCGGGRTFEQAYCCQCGTSFLMGVPSRPGDIRRMRVFLNLRQSDVSAATGISVSRLSAAENRRIKLRPAEESALREFLEVRARIVAESESERES